MLRKQRNKWGTRASYKPFTTRPIASKPQLLPCSFLYYTLDVATRDWLVDCSSVVVDELLSLYKSLAPIKKKTGGSRVAPGWEPHTEAEVKGRGEAEWGWWVGPMALLIVHNHVGKVCTTSTESDPFMIKYWDGRTIIIYKQEATDRICPVDGAQNPSILHHRFFWLYVYNKHFCLFFCLLYYTIQPKLSTMLFIFISNPLNNNA